MRVSKVHISLGTMSLLVELEGNDPRYTNESIAAGALEIYPSLSRHSCVNSVGPTFGCVISNTPLPHLLEHLIIAEQTRLALARGATEGTLVGVTHWVKGSDKRLAEVRVSFLDDLEAAEALSRALKVIESLVK